MTAEEVAMKAEDMVLEVMGRCEARLRRERLTASPSQRASIDRRLESRRRDRERFLQETPRLRLREAQEADRAPAGVLLH